MPSCKVLATATFTREAKRLRKRYPSLKSDLLSLITVLEEAPRTGKHLGQGVYKIRLAIKSKAKGKSGGARVVTYLRREQTLYLLSIYDKADQATITEREIDALIAKVGSEDLL